MAPYAAMKRRALGMVLAALGLLGCSGGEPVSAAAPAHSDDGHGPRIVWDLGERPFPNVPLPNDIATFPDPASPTGLRLNASLVAPTGLESRLREGFASMDGWGTFMPLTLAFDEPLDLVPLLRTMRGDDHAFDDDPVYLVNLLTGVPVPLDMGDGNFVYTARNRDGYYPNDPRGGQSNLLFETLNEDTNGNGVLDPGEDTNFDGRLNRAAVFPAGANPNDGLTPFWEPDTRTLILRPVLPLEERTPYAVVITSRLVGPGGRAVRSPFPTVAHPSQGPALAPLAALLRDRPNYYGALRYGPDAGATNADRVVFAWTFTTQTTTRDLLAVRDGLYGEGPFGRALAPVTPDLQLARAASGASCTADQRQRPFVVRGAALTAMVNNLAMALGLDDRARALVAERYRNVSHVVMGTYRVPYLMGDPASTDPYARWNLNTRTGQVDHVGTDTVQFALVVPKNLAGRRQPYPVVMQGHGYTGNFIDALGFGPNFAAQGLATLGINGPGHGLVLDRTQRPLIEAILRGNCLGGLLGPMLTTRARDLNGDAIPDSGGDFWTSYVFHTRDQVRQLALDHLQLIRAMRGFDGRALALDDFNNDGMLNDPAGDFDGDGTPDVGGPDARFYATGGSLGGIMAMVLGAADPNLRAAAPIAGGGGLTDIGIRSTQGGIKEAVILRVMGPLVMSVPARDYAPRNNRTRTACTAGQASLRFLVPDVNDTGELEFACADVRDEPGSPDTPGGPPPPTVHAGDDVTVVNLRTEERRCARAGVDGRFRIGIPSNTDDPLAVLIYRGAAITDYGSCAVRDDARIKSVVSQQRVVEGDCDVHCGHIPDATGPAPDLRRWVARGAQLRSPAEGLGIRRQTPEMRRFLLLAQAALDPGDPINFAPLFYRNRPAGHGPHGVLVLNTAGDQAVPVNTGNAFARAAGAIPFFAPDAVSRFPDYADFATPTALWDRYGMTPNRVLIERGVVEGLAALGRFPIPGRDAILFDVDDLDEGASLFGERTLTPPLRLVRYGRAATDAVSLAAAWTPTTGAYAGNGGAVMALLNAYIRPEGVHSFGVPDPALPWDHSTYLLTVIGRYFATEGQDILYRSRPDAHACGARHACDFLPPTPAEQ